MRARALPGALAVHLVLLLGVAYPADYWVRPGGSDAADGLSVATAWATLGHAADQVGPGDTVHVLDGDYQGFYQTTSGTPGNPITWHAEGPAVRITADNGTTPDGINLEGASHVVIDGFIVNGRTRAGIRAVRGSHVTVRNCTLGHNGRWGIVTGFVDDFLAEDNEAHHSQLEHGIYVANSCVRPIVRRNLVHHNFGNGLHFNGDLGLGAPGLIQEPLVERNVVWENGAGGGSGINMDGVQHGIIRNNLLYANHASGISLYRIDGAEGSKNNVVVNNTIVNAADGRWALNIANGSTGTIVRNNVLWTEHPFRGAITVDAASRPGLVSEHNALMDRFSLNGGGTVVSLAAWQAAGHDVTGSFLATPATLFVAPGTDFHLRSDAPAVDAGTAASAPADDVEGNPRPAGGGVDVGAYELQLLECGDGDVDAGEQCGEPGLGCDDPCTTCTGCVCALTTPVCGDGLVCGAEECETDGDCGGGPLCNGCACANPPVCASGIPLGRPSLSLRASPSALALAGEATIPLPWSGVDPPANGVRVVVDGARGPGGIDLVVPGGAGWKTNPAGTRWRYADAAGTRAKVQDRGGGVLRFAVKAKGKTAMLPAVTAVRTAVVLGVPAECAALTWGPPGAPRPRCAGDAARLKCR